jgi:hypothetical protein
MKVAGRGPRGDRGLPTVNRQDCEGTRDDVLAMGYVPCKICNP